MYLKTTLSIGSLLPMKIIINILILHNSPKEKGSLLRPILYIYKKNDLYNYS